MRIAVLGTGALGCVFAARLAPHAEVWMLGTWAEGIEAAQRWGISVEEPDGAVRCARPRATADPSTVPPADLALVLVKAYQTERAAAWAAQVLRSAGLAVTLQNGLDNGEKLAAAVGRLRTAVGVTYLGATLLGPGRVRHVAAQPTYVGLSPAGTMQRRDATRVPVECFAYLLNDAGLDAHIEANIEGRLWGKAVANAAINPLTALWRVPNGELLATPDHRSLLDALAEEAAAVARARGVSLPFDDPIEYVGSVCRATAANRSSMLQDVDRGRRTEVDSINGVIIAEGRRLGIPTPFNEALWRLVRGIGSSDQGSSGQSSVTWEVR
jgi:2-dehydropantoate 2-reductase